MDSPDASRGRWLRCPPCSHPGRHRPEDCLGREQGCCCAWCPGRAAAILADARARQHDPLVRELVLLASARVRRQQQADTWPQPARKVRCEGFEWSTERRTWVRCPQEAESGRFGRTRRYHSPQCARRAKWLRQKARREAVRGEVVGGDTSAPSTATSGRTGAGTYPGNPPEPSGAPGRAERERQALALFGLGDWLDQPGDAQADAEQPEVTAADRRRWQTPTGQRKPL